MGYALAHEKRRDRRIRRGLRRNKTWMVERDGIAIATVTLRRQGNKKLWTAAERRESAVYLSRLIVGRDHAGKAIGEALIDWAGLRAKRGWGAQWIRIDVWTTNVALHNYYEKRGFRPYGDQRPPKLIIRPLRSSRPAPRSMNKQRHDLATLPPTAAGSSRPFRLSRSLGKPGHDRIYDPDHRQPEGLGVAAANGMAERKLAHEASAG